MSDQEQLELFRAVLLEATKLFQETRKDIVILQRQLIALKESLAASDPQFRDHFQAVLVGVEKSLDAQKLPAEGELEKTLNELIVMLSSNKKRVN
jgi:hypothetical protein